MWRVSEALERDSAWLAAWHLHLNLALMSCTGCHVLRNKQNDKKHFFLVKMTLKRKGQVLELITDMKMSKKEQLLGEKDVLDN